jgi:hypothetical protein
MKGKGRPCMLEKQQPGPGEGKKVWWHSGSKRKRQWRLHGSAGLEWERGRDVLNASSIER